MTAKCIGDRLFEDVLREVGVPAPKPLPPPEKEELHMAAQARHREVVGKLRGMHSVLTGPLFLLQQLLSGKPGEPWLRSWVRLTISSPLLVFWVSAVGLWLWGSPFSSAVPAPFWTVSLQLTDAQAFVTDIRLDSSQVGG